MLRKLFHILALVLKELNSILADPILLALTVYAFSFSGLLVPVSSLSGPGRTIGLAFPAAWFQQVSIGAFTKGLGFVELWVDHLALAIFTVLFIGAAALILRKQEA